jgi:hypothetical protein
MSTLKNPGLAELSERRYRIVLEESWHHERPEVRNPSRIWYEQIPCQGEDCFIGVYSLEPLILQLSTSRPKNARAVWEAVKGTPGAKADFHFDGEAIIYFSPELVHIVAEIAGARKKRRLSEAHKAKLAEANQAYRFKPKFAASEIPEKAQI